MENIDITDSGLLASRIGLGTWAIGGWMWGGTDEAESVRTIQSAPDHGVTLIDVVQNPYNLFERQIDEDVMPWARTHDTRLLAYGALCRGLLSGRMHAEREFPGDDLRNNDPKFQQPRFDQYLAAVNDLETFAQDNYGKHVLDLAIHWALDQYPHSVALWGARKPDQLAAVDNVSGWQLDEDARAQLRDIADAQVIDPVGPEFMAPPARK